MQFRSNGICWATRPTNVCLVYLPPSYDVSTGKHYPTIYILHGFSLGRDVLDDWASVTKEWMDKLIASGQIQEMRTMIPGVGVAIAIEAAPSHFSSPLHSRFRVPSSEARHGPDEKHKSPPKYKTCTFEKPILRTRKETVRP